MRKLSILLLIFFSQLVAFGQTKTTTKTSNAKVADEELVQFSGMVLTSDSLMSIPYVNITISRTSRGAYSDLNGYFNFVASKGDTITFNCIGFKKSLFIIPDTLSTNKYSMVKLLSEDTIYLDPAIIRPLPLREMFDYYFVNSSIPDDDMERARKNLEREKIKEQSIAMKADGPEMGKYSLASHAKTYYYAGQIPPNTLLNPFAWAQFFEAWKRGDYKKTDEKLYDSEKE
ncbi:MAG: hypothetical protein ACI8ZN_002004 [Bacteroidia bacterium]|jgi:hypothetical protein